MRFAALHDNRWRMPKISLSLALILTGCVSVKMASKDDDARAKKFAPPPGKANVYVVRPSQVTLSALLFSVTIDGAPLGRTKVGTYLHSELPPGIYTLSTQSETKSTVKLVAEAGKNYFYLQDVGFGAISARSELLPMSEPEGRAGVLDTELADSTPPPPQAAELATPPTPPPATPAQMPGCGKDTDCKGDRICVSGACVEPPAKPVNGSALPPAQ